MKIITPVRLLTTILLVNTTILLVPLVYMYLNSVNKYLVLTATIGFFAWAFTILLLMVTYIQRGDLQDMQGNPHNNKWIR